MRHFPLIDTTGRVGNRPVDWWRGAVVYQIYPRSFADSNGDGVGDLGGITARLDYVASLGVDAVWISPFFKSPQKDYGYDVSDYRDVDPRFGTLKDFDALLARAHALRLKVLLDFVPSHTSDEHPWFAASRRSRDDPKADWYVWADPKPDGTPPNNWHSVFGGPAWTWDQRRRQYYCHHFLKEQPALNLWNEVVAKALVAEARFWFERGIDGFRVDAVDWALADAQLRNNPARRRAKNLGGMAPGSPFAMQVHLYDQARPELGEQLLKPFWRMSEAFDGAVLLGEISGDTALLRAAEYTRGGGLDMVYTFDLLSCPGTPDGIRTVIEALERGIGEGWMCWSFGNHDVLRAASRFGGADCPDALRRLIPVLLCALKGTVCLYQGEELGLEEAELSFEELQDPYGIAFWPDFKGRDGCRTPMPWLAAAPQAGFSDAKPWLPIPDAHRRRAVDQQEADPASALATTRRFLAWRKDQPALRQGSIRFIGRSPAILAFERAHAAQRLIAAFNLAGEAAELQLPNACELAGFVSGDVALRGRRLVLPPYGLAFLRPAA